MMLKKYFNYIRFKPQTTLNLFSKLVYNFHYYSYLPSASTTNMLHNLSRYQTLQNCLPCWRCISSKSTVDQLKEVLPRVGGR